MARMTGAPTFDLVVPTIGRPSLTALMSALQRSAGPRPAAIVVVDDRREAGTPMRLPDCGGPRPIAVRSERHGPAAARNAGWRRCSSPWIVFLDDDVLPDEKWLHDLEDDISRCPADTAVVQGGLTVPLPHDRKPTDYERNVAGLQTSAWITADLAVRRRALIDVGGFDERFTRAYREDTDLAIRLVDAGWRLGRGNRHVAHPVRTSTWRTSVSAQRGNADDALMRRLHGATWRAQGDAPAGALANHVATTTAGTVALAATVTGHRRVAILAMAVTSAGIARFWLMRASRGPRRTSEWAGLALSSLLIPFVATFWRGYGIVRALRLAPRGRRDRWAARPPDLVLFDRDGTLIHDVPYNGDPALITPVAGADRALDRLRRAGVAIGMITNQSGVARGLLTIDQVQAVNERTERLLGPFAVVEVCPHGEHERCDCRKPAPGMVLEAARKIGVAPHRCAVVGDIGSDVRAAISAGARGVLVPTLATSAQDIIEAPEVVSSVGRAVDLLLATGGAS